MKSANSIVGSRSAPLVSGPVVSGGVPKVLARRTVNWCTFLKTRQGHRPCMTVFPPAGISTRVVPEVTALWTRFGGGGGETDHLSRSQIAAKASLVSHGHHVSTHNLLIPSVPTVSRPLGDNADINVFGPVPAAPVSPHQNSKPKKRRQLGFLRAPVLMKGLQACMSMKNLAPRVLRFQGKKRRAKSESLLGVCRNEKIEYEESITYESLRSRHAL
jgi:hypothetical protein